MDVEEFDCKIHSILDTVLTQEQVAELFRTDGWAIRKWSWTGHEIQCSWADLYLDGEGEILMHGSITAPLTHAADLFAPLRTGAVHYWGEFYGPDGVLLREFRW